MQDLSGFRDPHVFPYLVKGFSGNTTKYESRRNHVEAKQTAERFHAEGFSAWIFELKELEDLQHVS